MIFSTGRLLCVLACTMLLLEFCYADDLKPCNKKLPKSAIKCGSSVACLTGFPCPGTTRVSFDYVPGCKSGGSCSQSCDSVGLTVCTATYDCEWYYFERTCFAGDPIIGADGKPLRSYKTEYGAVSCIDQCGD